MLKESKLLLYSKEFSQKKEKYEKLGLNISQAMELFLKEQDISYLSVYHRIKDEKSFLEKIERKGYEEPFEQTEDICGIRIICYYQSDVDKINNIIENEFSVLLNEDKTESLKDDQFGYRSVHFIVKIVKKWLQAPNYRGLENLKAEIQVRTVLMHAWAEIQHKLAYKKESDIPKQFKRKLNRISAKLEEADEQFEEIKTAVLNYKEDVIQSTDLDKLTNVELNLDSLQAFLDSKFPDLSKNVEATRQLLDELKEYKIDLNELLGAYNKVFPYLNDIGKDTFEDKPIAWVQTGVVRYIMDIANSNYCNGRGIPDYVIERSEKWRKIIYNE